MSICIYLRLPANIHEKQNITNSISVHHLKTIIERLYGIPCELQILENNGKTLQDGRSLQAEGVNDNSEIVVNVDFWWVKIVSLSLQGNSQTLGRRVSVPMQQIAEGNRIFVSLFISAARGYVNSVKKMLETFKDFDLSTCTKITGKTVLHAAISSGSLKCVEEIKKNAGMKFEQLLYQKDKSGTSPLGALCRNNLRMLNYVNKFISRPISPNNCEYPQPTSYEKENTFIVDKQNKRSEGKESFSKLGNHLKNEAKIPKLEREKSGSVKITPTRDERETSSVSPLIHEKTENSSIIRIGHESPINEKLLLPTIGNPSNGKGPVIRKSLSPTNLNVLPRSPRPPTRDNKKRAVAGVLTDSNIRKFSASK